MFCLLTFFAVGLDIHLKFPVYYSAAKRPGTEIPQKRTDIPVEQRPQHCDLKLQYGCHAATQKGSSAKAQGNKL